MQTLSNNLWLFKIYFKKGRKNRKRKNCENSKLVNPRYLGYFYYHGKMILPCIKQQETIRNWVTFCGYIIY